MADLLVRGVPVELHERYRRLARKHRRSLPAETLYLIEKAVREEEQLEAREAALARIARRRRRAPAPPADAPDSLTLLREDRAR